MKLFLFTLLDLLFTASLAQKLIYAINIWFNFVFASFFDQDCLLNLIILAVYAKRWLKYAGVSKQKLMQAKIWSMIFFLTLTFRGPFPRKFFKGKRYGGTGLLSEKWKFCMHKFNERVEAATSSYSAADDFLQYIYSMIMAKNHQKIL